jgi:hypothetical protein
VKSGAKWIVNVSMRLGTEKVAYSRTVDLSEDVKSVLTALYQTKQEAQESIERAYLSILESSAKAFSARHNQTQAKREKNGNTRQQAR